MGKIIEFMVYASLGYTVICLTCIVAEDFIMSNEASATAPEQPPFTYVCDPAHLSAVKLDVSTLGFCDKSLPYSVRVEDLVDQLSVEEKVLLLGSTSPGVPRLGLPKYEWWNEALHGVSSVGGGSRFDAVVPGATSFPTVILSTASFNEDLWKRIGQVVSNEARAMYNLGRAGLTFWSPVINVVRDPRWGRTQETPGEDPFVVGRYAANFVRGLQDVRGTEHIPDLNARPLKVSACCKHYAAYDVDNWKGVDRLHFDARVTEQDMVETFLKPFEMCVKEGDVSSIMCSYNRVNGIPTCADPKLLNQTVRGDWGLRGYLVSDCDSIEVMVDNHQFINDTNEDAVAQTLKAGLDLDCGNYYPKFTMSSIRQGKVSVEDVDKALRNLYMLMMRLGYFDGSPEFKNLGKKDICSSRNIDLAVEAARQGIVLLKNDNGTLPFDRNTIKNLAVVGPHASVTDIMIGNYAGTPCRYITPTDGFSTYTNVQTQQGCEDVLCNNDKLIGAAVDAAKTADATVIMVGLSLKVEAESLDRLHLFLPGFQTQLINQVADAAKGPVVLIIMSAGGIDITFAKNNPKIKAILWAGYPGQEGGRAIADVVFGTYNPGGRLPITWYEGSYVEKLPMTSMQLRPLDNLGYPGRTYKFYNGTTVYPFGYGLSYSQFTYKIQSPNPSTLDVKLTRFQHCHDIDYKPGTQKPTCPSVKIEDGLACDTHYTINTQIQITNTGTRDGDQAVIVYSKAPEGILGAPIKQVIGFRRVGIRAGQTVTVPFQFNACKALSIVDYQAHTVLPAGQHSIVVGDGVASYTYDVNFT